MSNLPVAEPVGNPAPILLDYTSSFVASFLAGRTPHTLEAYRQDLEGFRRFAGGATLDEAAELLLADGHGQANRLALAYKAQLKEDGLQAATVNRRLASLRSLVRLARIMGMVAWTLEVQNERAETYRDTRGPGTPTIGAMFQQLNGSPKAVRDRCILRLLYDLGLRVSSVVNLDLADFDGSRIAVTLKGRSGKHQKSLPEPTRAALVAWLEVRGSEPGPLFTNFDRAGKGSRLARQSVYRMVRKLGEDVGQHVRPHGIRHTAITEACKRGQEEGYKLEEITQFSDHRDVRTLMIYRDQDRDVQGKLAELVADGV